MNPAPLSTHRQLHLNAFLFGAGHHSAAWRHPASPAEQLGEISYWERLARTAERGFLDAVFFADGHSPGDVASGPRWFLEPLTALSAMARGTERIGLVCTISTTFFTPFHAARMLASLDHISGGRAGWNVVTSMFDAEARNHGLEAMPTRQQRYARAEEFVQVTQQLWDSWADNAVLADRTGLYADPARLHPMHHRGEHFHVDGPLTVPRPPQGRPVLFQAGASGPGRELVARYAEGIYAGGLRPDRRPRLLHRRQSPHHRRRAQPGGGGGDARTGHLPRLHRGRGPGPAGRGRRAAAHRPVAGAAEHLRPAGLQRMGPRRPGPPVAPTRAVQRPQGRYATILRIIEVERPTVRQLLGRQAAGGGHCTMVGTPEDIADRIEHWFRTGAADGFNLMPPTLPDALENFIDHVVPELQRRGLFRTHYTTDTLRGHLGLPHPARGTPD